MCKAPRDVWDNDNQFRYSRYRVRCLVLLAGLQLRRLVEQAADLVKRPDAIDHEMSPQDHPVSPRFAFLPRVGDPFLIPGVSAAKKPRGGHDGGPRP